MASREDWYLQKKKKKLCDPGLIYMALLSYKV